MSALLAPKTSGSKAVWDQPIRPTTPPRTFSRRDVIDDLDDSHICGYYESSDGKLSLTCPSNLYCTHDIQRLLLGCCDDADGLGCDYTTICYDSTATETITSTSIFRVLDGYLDTMKFFGMKCTDSEFPYCAQNYWTDASVKQYYCESSRDQIWFLGVRSDSSTDTTATDSTSVFPSSVTAAAATSISTAETASASTKALEPSEASSSSTPDTTDSGNTAVIAGGIVGGIASLGLLVAVILWLRKRRIADQKSGHPTGPSFNVIGSSILRNQEAASRRNGTMGSTATPTSASASMTQPQPTAQQPSIPPPVNNTFSSPHGSNLVEAPSDFAPSQSESHHLANISPTLPLPSLRPESRVRRASSDSNLQSIDFGDSEADQRAYVSFHERRVTPMPGQCVDLMTFARGMRDRDLGRSTYGVGPGAGGHDRSETRGVVREAVCFDGQAPLSERYRNPEARMVGTDVRGRGLVGSRSGPVSDWYVEDGDGMGGRREIR